MPFCVSFINGSRNKRSVKIISVFFMRKHILEKVHGFLFLSKHVLVVEPITLNCMNLHDVSIQKWSENILSV